jgi:DNA repair exonuclease SbcCD ATPase subunit
MIDEDYTKFKFNGDEPESEESIYQEEEKDRRVEKLSHRVTIISILIPCLIGVVFYITYRDITGRVSQSQDTGALEIQSLTTQLEENFNNLSTKYSELEASLIQRLAALEKVDKTINENIKKAELTLSKINSSKVDKKEQENAIAKIDVALGPIREELKTLAPIKEQLKTIAPMRSELSSLSAEIKALDKDLKAKLATLSTNTDKTLKDLTKMQSEISLLSNQKLDKDSMQLELLRAKKNYQTELDLTKSVIDKRLASILRKVKDLEKMVQTPPATKIPPTQRNSSASGDIVEQEISE